MYIFKMLNENLQFSQETFCAINMSLLLFVATNHSQRKNELQNILLPCKDKKYIYFPFNRDTFIFAMTTHPTLFCNPVYCPGS